MNGHPDLIEAHKEELSMMSQKEAVFAALVSVLGTNEFEGPVNPTKEERAQVNNILFEGFRAGRIQYDGDVESMPDAKLRSYVSGLQSNWLRKDTRLNGGVKYVPKNPGSRAGSTDPQIKAMRVLLSTKTDPVERAEIQKFIDKRLAEIRPAKTVTFNVDDLPEELRHLVESAE